MSQLTVADEAMARAHQVLMQQIGNVETAGNEARSIVEELRQGYISHSGNAFQMRVEDWIARYDKVRAAFDHLMTATEAANKNITGTDEELAGYGAPSSDTSIAVHSELTPSR